jgi:hypothetical protein
LHRSIASTVASLCSANALLLTGILVLKSVLSRHIEPSGAPDSGGRATSSIETLLLERL